MKSIIANLKKKIVGEEIFPKQEVYSSRDGKELIFLGLNKKDLSYLVFLDITNSGVVKVNPFDACFNVSSVKVILDPIEKSLEGIESGSLRDSKLPFFTRIWVGMREGVLESYHLFKLNDDGSERCFTEVYFYRNKLREEKVRITRTEGRGKKRESGSKVISFAAYKGLRDSLSKLLAEESEASEASR